MLSKKLLLQPRYKLGNWRLMQIAQSWLKDKGGLLRHAGAKGERRHRSYSFLTSALDGGVFSFTPWLRLVTGERPPVLIG
jgi:hypothetical protein